MSFDDEKTVLLTSYIFKLAIDFTSHVDFMAGSFEETVDASLIGTARPQPPVLAVCSQRFLSALPPLLCCTQEETPATDFATVYSKFCPTIGCIYSLNVHLRGEQGKKKLFDELIGSMRATPLLYLNSFKIDSVHRDTPLAALWEVLPRRLQRLNLHCFERAPLTNADVIAINESFPLLENLECATVGRGAFLAPRGKKNWFPKLRALDCKWADLRDAVALSFFPQLEKLAFWPADNTSVIDNYAVPETGNLQRVRFFFDHANIHQLDLSGCARYVVDLGHSAFNNFNARLPQQQQQRQPQRRGRAAAAAAAVNMCGFQNGVLDLSDFEQLQKIGEEFCVNGNIKTLRLPSSIREIDTAFLLDCMELETLDADFSALERWVTTCTFFVTEGGGCQSLKNVDFLATIPPERGVFWGETSSTAHTPRQRNVISASFAKASHALTSVDLRALLGVVRIEHSFFRDCFSLTKVSNFSALRTVRRIGKFFFADTDLNVNRAGRNYSFDCSFAEAFAALEDMASSVFLHTSGGKVDLRGLGKLRIVRVCDRIGAGNLRLPQGVVEQPYEQDEEEEEMDDEEEAGDDLGDFEEEDDEGLLDFFLHMDEEDEEGNE